MLYFVLFKDDATSYLHVYLMKKEGDVVKYFKVYNAISMYSVKRLHTDNRSEYVHNEFKEYLGKEGITHECTVRYILNQNGRAERQLRTIIESARSMLYARYVPLNLWSDAVNTALYLLNRTSSINLLMKPFLSYRMV